MPESRPLCHHSERGSVETRRPPASAACFLRVAAGASHAGAEAGVAPGLASLVLSSPTGTDCGRRGLTELDGRVRPGVFPRAQGADHSCISRGDVAPTRLLCPPHEAELSLHVALEDLVNCILYSSRFEGVTASTQVVLEFPDLIAFAFSWQNIQLYSELLFVKNLVGSGQRCLNLPHTCFLASSPRATSSRDTSSAVQSVPEAGLRPLSLPPASVGRGCPPPASASSPGPLFPPGACGGGTRLLLPVSESVRTGQVSRSKFLALK